MEKYIYPNVFNPEIIEAEPMTLREYVEKTGEVPKEYLSDSVDDRSGFFCKTTSGKSYWATKSFVANFCASLKDTKDLTCRAEVFLLLAENLCGEVKQTDVESDEKRGTDILSCRALFGYLVEKLFTAAHNFWESSRGEGNNLTSLSFSEALFLLKDCSSVITREAWKKDNSNLFVFRQVPACIGEDVIPKMQSVPKVAKDLILHCGKIIDYNNQCIIYNLDACEANSWSPSAEDIFADDWEVVDNTFFKNTLRLKNIGETDK